MRTTLNRLQVKALMLSLTMELKGYPPLPNSAGYKKEFKRVIGLAKNCSNVDVMAAICQVYADNNLESEFNHTLERLGIDLFTFKPKAV